MPKNTEEKTNYLLHFFKTYETQQTTDLVNELKDVDIDSLNTSETNAIFESLLATLA